MVSLRSVGIASALILLLVPSASCAGPRVASDDSGAQTRAATTSDLSSEGSYRDARANGVLSSPRVMFIGDSLLGGLYASQESKTWSVLVVSSLESETGIIDVVPAPRKDLPRGTPTTTSSFDLSQMPRDLGLAVVELGTNDAGQDVDLDLFVKQYSLILDQIRSTSPNSYLVCLSTWRPSAAYDAAIEAACTTRPRASYADIGVLFDASGTRGPSGRDTPFGISDDFHPNDAGHRAIADTVLKSLGGA
jgi:acyl-CoA thioesterase-1